MNNLKEQDLQEAEAFTLKNKRDQYVFEIRKQKTEDIIKTKRLKLSSALDGQRNPERNTGMMISGQNRPQNMGQQEKVTQSFQDLTQAFFNSLSNNDINGVYHVVQTIRQKISDNDSPPLNEFFETGLFPHLEKYLDPEYKEYVELQFEVMWIVTNVFTGDDKQVVKIVTKPLLETILKYIWHPKHEMVEQVSFEFYGV